MNSYNESQKLECQYCGKECKNKNSLAQHEIRCKNNPDKLYVDITHLSEANKLGRFTCQYCGREFKHFNNLKSHEVYCKSNPNHINSWNYGLTKETNASIWKASRNLTGKVTGKASTPEKEELRIQHIKESMAKNPNSGGIRKGFGRGKKGWYKDYYCDSTYELVYVIYNLDHNIGFSRNTNFYEYEIDGKVHKYYPDFLLSDNTYVEIKGYHTDLVDIKLASVTDRPIKILYESDLKYAFDYVENTYSYKNLTDLYNK